VGPSASLEVLEKKKFCPYRDSNSDPSPVQPIASCYTDYVIPVPSDNDDDDDDYNKLKESREQ
jgi:hypothetical protein